MKAKIGVAAAVALVVVLVSMSAFVPNQFRYERALLEKTAPADAMNLATQRKHHGVRT